MSQLNCPRCQNEALSPSFLEKGLSTESCPKCQGHWLLIENFVMWKENYGDDFLKELKNIEENEVHEGEVVVNQAPIASAQKKVLLCPYSGKLMQRFFIHHTLENRLNFSNALSGVWLDSGDWALLKSLDLALELNRIFTTNWQNSVRQQQLDASLEQRHREKLGNDDFDKLKEFREWLYAHPEKEMMIAYMMNNNQ